jgi:hypothetical protein
MRCTGGLGLPLPTVLRRLLMAALLACLSSLALLVPLALAEDAPASDPSVASDPAASTPVVDPATDPGASDPATEPAAAAPEPPVAVAPEPVAAPEPPVAAPEPPVAVAPEPPVAAPDPPAVAPDPPGPSPDPPAAEPAPFADPTPVVEPVIDPPVIELPVPDLPDPVATTDDPSTTGDPGDSAVAAPLDPRPPRGSAPDVGDTLSQPSSIADEAAPSGESPEATPDPVAVVIPTPDALAPASWRWPSPATPGSPGATSAGLASSFLSTAPPVMAAVPSALPGDDGTRAEHRNGTRHAPPAAWTEPAPWSPGAPGAPVSASGAAPAGAAGGIGGWALPCLLFVLLALAAPRRVLPRPALSPVLALRPVYAPARAPPAS